MIYSQFNSTIIDGNKFCFIKYVDMEHDGEIKASQYVLSYRERTESFYSKFILQLIKG